MVLSSNNKLGQHRKLERQEGGAHWYKGVEWHPRSRHQLWQRVGDHTDTHAPPWHSLYGLVLHTVPSSAAPLVRVMLPPNQ